jgi:hypothetical protein
MTARCRATYEPAGSGVHPNLRRRVTCRGAGCHGTLRRASWNRLDHQGCYRTISESNPSRLLAHLCPPVSGDDAMDTARGAAREDAREVAGDGRPVGFRALISWGGLVRPTTNEFARRLTCDSASGWGDLNSRPLDPQSSALTKLRHSPSLARGYFSSFQAPPNPRKRHCDERPNRHSGSGTDGQCTPAPTSLLPRRRVLLHVCAVRAGCRQTSPVRIFRLATFARVPALESQPITILGPRDEARTRGGDGNVSRTWAPRE